MASISMKRIVKQYSDGFPAVNDVSLEVADGEFVILVLLFQRRIVAGLTSGAVKG